MSSTAPQRPGDAPAAPGDAADAPAQSTGTTGPDTGRHAVQRPTPTPPEPSTGPAQAPPDPVLSPTVTRPTTADPGPERPARHDEAARTGGVARPADGERVDGDGERADGDVERADEPLAPAGRGDRGDGVRGHDEAHGDEARGERDGTDGDRAELFPDAHAPRTPHAGTHVLGALVGIVLAPFAVVLLLLGQSRVLEVQVDGWDASLELLGIVLVSAGALVLAVLLALGLWSAAVPLTAGLLVGALGGLQLYAPGVARDLALDALGGGTWDRPVALATVAGTSGTTFTVGLLLLTAGVVLALARRHGVRLGAFRERNRAT